MADSTDAGFNVYGVGNSLYDPPEPDSFWTTSEAAEQRAAELNEDFGYPAAWLVSRVFVNARPNAPAPAPSEGVASVSGGLPKDSMLVADFRVGSLEANVTGKRAVLLVFETDQGNSTFVLLPQRARELGETLLDKGAPA